MESKKILTGQDISCYGQCSITVALPILSAFLGEYLKTNDINKAIELAASFVVSSIENTLDDPSHNYGVKFEPLLAQYIGGKNNEIIF